MKNTSGDSGCNTGKTYKRKEVRDKRFVTRRRIQRSLKYVLAIAGLYLIFCIISVWLFPLIGKKTGGEAERGVVEQEALCMEERVRSIDDNYDALVWRIRLIEAAEEEIIFSTFDMRSDRSGKEIMACLYMAAERGVSVKIIVDGINDFLRLDGDEYFEKLISHPLVEAKVYNQVNLLKPWKLNYRMHDKYLIADNTAYILGGRNTNNLFLGDYRESYNIDRDVLVYVPDEVQSSSLMSLRVYFESVWNRQDCRRLTGEKVAGDNEFQEIYDGCKSTMPEAFSEFDWKEETLETAGIRLLSNPIESTNKEPLVWNELIELMSEGDDILIQTPYVICDDEMYEDVAGLTSSGRQVRIMTNAVEEGANPWGCTDYLNEKYNILNTGVMLNEVLCGQSQHAKTILIDDNISIVGSFNMDMRSAYLDTELMLVIYCEELNSQIREQCEEMLLYSKEVYEDGNEAYGSKYEPVEMGGSQKVFYGVLRFVVKGIRHLL